MPSKLHNQAQDASVSGKPGRRHKVLVTGGMGFLGSTLVRHLLDTGNRVTVIDHQVPSASDWSHSFAHDDQHLRILACRISHPDVRSALDSEVSVIFNLAGQPGHRISMESPETDLAMNVQDQLAFLGMVRDDSPQAAVVHSSTRQVYGRVQQQTVSEFVVPRPPDINGVHKLALEGYHSVFSAAYGVPSVSLRLPNLIGPGSRMNDAEHGVVGHWIGCGLRGEAIEVWGDGGDRRDFLHVEDAATALVAAVSLASSSGEVFNVPGAEQRSLLSVAEEIAESTGVSVVRSHAPQDSSRISLGSLVLDGGAFLRESTWRSTRTVAQGIADAVDFGRRFPHRWVRR